MTSRISGTTEHIPAAEIVQPQTAESERSGLRKHSPVFVMGCHRSGTNLLYDMLLSAGGFAVYRGYLPVYKILIPRFGRLDVRANRERMMATWLRSKGFRRSGLDGGELTQAVLANCRNGGDFLRITMDEVARRQSVVRWAVYDPDTVLHVPSIKRDIPQALFVHIIRDGRDIALSLRKMGGFNPFPWARGTRSLEETALYWKWMVDKGRQYGRAIPRDYVEVRYEDLVSGPEATLRRLGDFIEHDLDYRRIQEAALGRVSESNSSFREEATSARFNPVGRWKERLSPSQVAALESLIGPTLEACGYSLTTAEPERRRGIRANGLRAIYPAFLDAKLWLKMKTPLGRLGSLDALELANDSAMSRETAEVKRDEDSDL